MSIYEQCAYETEGAGTEVLLECVTGSMQATYDERSASLKAWLLVICGALIFFMQVGFAMLCGGCVRKKNVQNTMLKNLLDACGAAVAFFSVGFAFAFGGQNETTDITFVGTTNFFGTGDIDRAFWFFEYAFSATAVTIVAGTLAERCQMVAYLCYSLFLTAFVYPVVAHSIWSNNGFISAFSVDPFRGVGVIDFAGSAVVHVTGGTTALIATYILGARKGRFHDSRGRLLPVPRVIQGHSMALQLMGTMVLWFGWYGFNSGSALTLPLETSGNVAALAAINTTLSASAGCMSALFTFVFRHERETGEYKFDLAKAMNGALGGLVSITAGCATVEPWAALVIGSVAGLLYLLGSWWLVRIRLDDAVDAIPVHLFNGVWGMIATGLFTSPGRMYDAFGTYGPAGLFYEIGQGSFDATLLGNQALGVLFVAGWIACTMTPFFSWLNMMGWFRSDSLEELVGLDLSYMGNRQSILDMGGDDFSDFEMEQSSQDLANKDKEDPDPTADEKDEYEMNEVKSQQSRKSASQAEQSQQKRRVSVENSLPDREGDADHDELIN